MTDDAALEKWRETHIWQSRSTSTGNGVAIEFYCGPRRAGWDEIDGDPFPPVSDWKPEPLYFTLPAGENSP